MVLSSKVGYLKGYTVGAFTNIAPTSYSGR
jgi:hypothetical protein